MLPEEQELNRLESEQATLEDQVATAELTLETLKAETAQFQYHYHQIVGRLFAELDKLVAQIAWAEAGLDPDNTEAQAQAEAAEQQAQKSAEEAGVTEKQAPPPREITPEIKRAFRQAAKLMHPDRATTHAERERRTAVMAQVNVAYANGDRTAIEKLMIEFGQDPEAIIGGDVAARLVKTIRRIAQLRRRIAEAQQEIAIQKAQELHELMITVTEAKELGGDPLGDLAKQIMQQISERKIELETIRQRRVADVNL
ncbi:J domain-containing protein [Methyloglobulus sp.]|uniref:J domain-containing protein n=1 Tax=Methyloglobulus sp. TaxID=2518622 RepID=UPI003989452B